MADLWGQAEKCYAKHFAEIINLGAPNVEVGSIVGKLYLPWLQEYESGKYNRADPDAFWDMYLQSKEYIRPEEEQRSDGGWLRDPETGEEVRNRAVPEDFDKRYLFTVYECIKKYGYGKGPFQYNYVHAQKIYDDPDDVSKERYLIRGSHRAACLKMLGYKDILAVIIN